MKLPKEIINGFLIFILIGLYFLLMEALGLAKLFYLRLINILFLFYGVNKTISMNVKNGRTKFVPNVVAAILTSLIGVFLSFIGLIIYATFKGGDAYIASLSKTFLFGGNPSIDTYSVSLLFEGIASSVIVTLVLIFKWNNKFESD